MPKCPSCSAEVAETDVHCGSCGKPIEAPAPAGVGKDVKPKKTMMGMVAVQGPELERAIAAAKAAAAEKAEATLDAPKPAVAAKPARPAAPARSRPAPKKTMLGMAAVSAPAPAAPKPAAPPVADTSWASDDEDAEGWGVEEEAAPVGVAPKVAAPSKAPTPAVSVPAARAPAAPAVARPAPGTPAAPSVSMPAKTVAFEAAPTAPMPTTAAPSVSTPAKTVAFEAAPTAHEPPPATPAPSVAKPARTVAFDAAPTAPSAPAAPQKPVLASPSLKLRSPAPRAAQTPVDLAKTLAFEAAPTAPSEAATPTPATLAPTPAEPEPLVELPLSRAPTPLPPQLANTAIMDAVDVATAEALIAARRARGETPVPLEPPPSMEATPPEAPAVPPESPEAVGVSEPVHVELPAGEALAPEEEAPVPAEEPILLVTPARAAAHPAEPGKSFLRWAAVVLGVLLIAAFFVPVGGGTSWNAFLAARGAGKLFAIWMPIAGAILVIAGLAPLGYALRAGVATVVGIVPLVGAGAGHGLPAASEGVRGVLTMVGVVALAAALIVRGRFHASLLARVVVAASAILLLGVVFAPANGQVPLLASLEAGGPALLQAFGTGALLVLVLLSFLAFLGRGTSGGCILWGNALVVWLPAMACLVAATSAPVNVVAIAVATFATGAYSIVAIHGLHQILASISEPP